MNECKPLPIGTIGGPGRSAFAVDELRFWNHAKTPVAVWSQKDKFLSGLEPFLVSYLPLEEGCGDTTADRAAAAVAGGRPTWRLSGVNLTIETFWEMQKRSFSCASAGGVLRTSTRPTLKQRTESARRYEHSPRN